ncbi:MAG: tRNA dihydrouridine synthase DusB [Candidatus Cloacimonetes bacterium]|jgi:tRNA-dihydrouridine synthase B|nr:tRNA dihydrouridine synthase DusB [Candidatus Cloacimonadota bacterium]
MSITIKDLTENKVWLAPLAGITDNSFRSICKECGADVVVSEMISADGLLHNRDRSLEYARFDDEQRPYGIQLFGSDPEVFKNAVKIALTKKPDFIDINMGCPVKKVIKHSAGSALMTEPDVAAEIVSVTKKILIPHNIPLSVKFRSGWDMFSINSLEFGRNMQNAGADMICLHPRTRGQMFSGKSNWDLITELKKEVSIPVIGNGDIITINDMIAMYERTGCDSVMIGRGVIGKPWFFTQIQSYLSSGDIRQITTEEKLKIINRHMELMISNKGERQAIFEMRTHFSHYTKGLRGSAHIRNRINKLHETDKILLLVEELFKANKI